MYFSEVCVVFSRARIAFPKNLEVKRTIYFDWPNERPMGFEATPSCTKCSGYAIEILLSTAKRGR